MPRHSSRSNRIRTTLSIGEEDLRRAISQCGPLSDDVYINLLVHKSVSPPYKESWKEVRKSDGRTLCVSDRGNVVVKYEVECKRVERASSYPKIRAYRDDKRCVLDCHVLVAELHCPLPVGARSGYQVCHNFPSTKIFHSNNLAWRRRSENIWEIRWPLLPTAPAPPLKELFLYHPKYAGLLVSNHGRFLQRYYQLRNTSGYMTKRGKRYVAKHVTVGFVEDGMQKPKHHLVHRLVYQAFGRESIEGRLVLHKDGNPHDNNIGNLKVGSAKDNADDRDRHKRTLRGNESPLVTVADHEAIIHLRGILDGRLSQRAAARKMAVSSSTVSAWISRRNRPELIDRARLGSAPYPKSALLPS
jgi:DNA-binding transcriptional regulator YiaG